MEDYDPKAFLLFGLQHFGLPVNTHEGNMVYLAGGYQIEIEGKSLFKLMQNGQVIGPFGGVEALCSFLKQDMALNQNE
ncbi:hypothetical protein [Flavilitoribacter nigricans]|uniref:Uncharacterized protein n=1 Tax=Flavilitoribacter nigricans (strain ATCC 23147 / DSM 23189 / NBRC 102662 / NCIMB 1420 / SS-2) TaxID=1122177 RepID=A0A2D0N610_FLAN2|nr:hypothetical protein [Flavilitoribacter nigricans]PHN03830.1 hypothetical protein CRP01_25120 [Flavilitoribacter nigricans DSM 23189 = NBRC 102662]